MNCVQDRRTIVVADSGPNTVRATSDCAPLVGFAQLSSARRSAARRNRQSLCLVQDSGAVIRAVRRADGRAIVLLHSNRARPRDADRFDCCSVLQNGRAESRPHDLDTYVRRVACCACDGLIVARTTHALRQLGLVSTNSACDGT